MCEKEIIEVENGQLGCDGCLFLNQPVMCRVMKCTDDERTDGKNVIYKYEEDAQNEYLI
jgi:hypothetical protein